MVSLARVWRSVGVEPDAVVGNSQGEIAAAFVAGALSLEDAIAGCALRSRSLLRLDGVGQMALVELGAAEVERRLAGGCLGCGGQWGTTLPPRFRVPRRPWRRCSNGSSVRRCSREGSVRAPLRCTHTVRPVELLKEELAAHGVGWVRPVNGGVPMLSTVTVDWLGGPELDAGYWYRNLREPVRFGAAVERLVADGFRHFVEIGPHTMLAGAVRSALETAGVDGTAVGSLRRDEGSLQRLWCSLAELHCRGLAVDWARVLPRGRMVALPTYPFQRQRYWLEATPARRARSAETGGHPLIGPAFRMSVGSDVYYERELSPRQLAWLGEHEVESANVLPGAAALEMLCAAVGGGLASVKFVEPVVLPARVQIAVRDGQATLSQAVGDAWEVRVRAIARTVALPDLPLERAGLEERAPETLYEALRKPGLRHGPSFRGIVGLWAEAGRALGRVELPAAAGPAIGYGVHPALLDACLQVAAATGKSQERGCRHRSKRSP